MVKIVLTLFFAVNFIFASLLDSKIKSFVGEGRYYKDKRIINIVIGNRTQYIKNGSVDSVKLIKVLKNNGFINLVFKKPQKVAVTFKVQKDALLFLKIINSSLNAIGFNFFMTKEAINNQDGFTWTIVMDTENLIDPVYLSNELEKRGCRIVDIDKKDDLDWTYTVSMQNVKLLAKDVLNNATYKLKKPIKPYWLNIANGAKTLFVKSFPPNRWHPYVLFLDKELNILSIYDTADAKRSIKVDIPENCKYIMMDDKYTLSNIRSGLQIYISSK